MENVEKVRCNNCYFIGMEEDLENVVEFEKCEGSGLEHLLDNEFFKEHTEEDVFSMQYIKGCPVCLTDRYLMDIEDTE